MKKILIILFSLLLSPAAFGQTTIPDQRPHAGQTAFTNKPNVFKQSQTFNGSIVGNGTIFGNLFSGSGASITSLNANNISSGNVGCAFLPSLIGDLTNSGCTLTLDTVNSNVGTYNGITVNAKGLVTSASFTNDSAVLVATTANLNATYNNGASGVGATLTNAGTQAAFTQDGISVPLNGRVLVWKQTSQFQNGIYQLTNQGSGATNWVLTRTSDFDGSTSGNVYQGATVPVIEGTTYSAFFFIETGLGPFTIGTTAIIFTGNQAASGGAVTSVSGDGSIYTNSGSTGAVSLTLGNQNANQVFAGPASGSAATPTVRSLVPADLPSITREAVTAFARGNQTGSLAVPDQEAINGRIARYFKAGIWTGLNNFIGGLQSNGANVLTSNQTITLTGDTTGSGTTSIATSTVKVNGGLVPASAAVAGTNGSSQIVSANAANVVSLFSGCSGTQYLGADGACHAAGGGSGTVTSVAVGTGLTASPSPITASGTISEGNYTLAAKTAVFMNAGGL